MESWQYQNGKPHIYLKPGELCVSERAIIVTTVLGSCVSATFFHRPTGLAAICHAMQPRCPKGPWAPGRCPPECKNIFRYAVCAIQTMKVKMVGLGVRPVDLEVKLFGGAALIGTCYGDRNSNSIGKLNVEAAMETINSCNLALKVADVGGVYGRKLIFDTGTGQVLMKRLNNADARHIQRGSAHGKTTKRGEDNVS